MCDFKTNLLQGVILEICLLTPKLQWINEQNNNIEDLNFDINFNLANNNFNLNIQQDNKINNNKIFDFNEDKIGLTKQFNNSDFLLNLQTSRKMSLEEKII